MKLGGQKSELLQKISFYAFSKINIYTMFQNKNILLTIYPNMLSYKALAGNTIYEMKVCIDIDGVFKLFEIVVLANFCDKYSQK